MSNWSSLRKFLVLEMWFLLYLPYVVACIIIDVLANEGPEWAQRAIRRHDEKRAMRK